MLLSPGDGQASAGRPGLRARFADWRRDFRPWRRQRPFVGGVLVALAGLEMLLSGPIKLDQLGMNIVLQFGVEGAQATILPLALTLLGILSIAQPVHRVFYGVIALAISVYSIAGVNLGGWVVGFLLGVVGGVVVVSWAPPPAVAETAGESTADDTSGEAAPGTPAGEDATGDASAEGEAAAQGEAPAEDEAAAEGDGPRAAAGAPGPAAEGGGSAKDSLSGALRALSQKSAAVVVAGAMALGGASLPASASMPASADSSQQATTSSDDSFWCTVFRICDDSGEPEPSASPSDGATDPGAGEDPGEGTADPADGAEDGAGDGAADGAGGDAGAGDGAAGGDEAADPGAGAGQDGEGAEEPECKEPTQEGEVPPEEADVAPSDPCGEIDPQKVLEEALQTELGTCVKVTFGGKFDLNVQLPGQCGTREDGNVFSLPADLESRDLTIPLTGINGIGLANVPVKGDGGGRRDAIKISADKVVVDGFWLKSYAYDHGTVAGTDTRASSVSLEGDAHMYVSSIHADLPDGQDLLEVATKVLEGASLIELLLTATDARMGFLGATSQTQVWDTFREQVWGDPTDPIGKGPTAGTP